MWRDVAMAYGDQDGDGASSTVGDLEEEEAGSRSSSASRGASARKAKPGAKKVSAEVLSRMMRDTKAREADIHRQVRPH